MLRHQFSLCLMILSTLVTACTGTNATSTDSAGLKIMPEICVLNVGENTPMTLNGQIPTNPSITWSASQGNLISSAPNINAVFTAPLTPAIVTITVTIIADQKIELTRECKIDAPETATVPNSTALPTTLEAGEAKNSIVITEVMSTPCGGAEFKQWNQYVELYNTSDQPIDVAGLWLLDRGEIGTPDQLVSWKERVYVEIPASNVITNTSIIPAHEFAVILSPMYVQGISPHQKPYAFPDGTIMLTLKDSNRLGDDLYGIVGEGLEPDFLVLYQGGLNSLTNYVSTYGNPIRASFLPDILDTPNDGLPLENIPDCWSAEKINASGKDEYSNWHMLKGGNPGEGNYRKP